MQVLREAMTNPKTLYIARHGETVFNKVARMQGRQPHTPLTIAGMEQARAMGEALRDELGVKPDINLWTSSAGRARQTLALITEVLEMDYFTARSDERLVEIDVGYWTDRLYADIHHEIGPFVDPFRRLYTQRPPDGEWYDDIAHRMASWLEELDEERPALVITHGMAGRVLRGLLLGGEGDPAIADDAPQGTIFRIENGVERAITPKVIGRMTPA